MKRLFILFDSRACGGLGTQTATALLTCSSDSDSRENCEDYGSVACYSYKVDKNNNVVDLICDKVCLSDERWEWDHIETNDSFDFTRNSKVK